MFSLSSMTVKSLQSGLSSLMLDVGSGTSSDDYIYTSIAFQSAHVSINAIKTHNLNGVIYFIYLY